GGSLPGDALALVLAWDAAGSCISARHDDPTGLAASRSEPCGDRWLHRLPPDARTRPADRVRDVLAGGEAREEPLRLADADRWAVLRLHAVDPSPPPLRGLRDPG